MHFSWERRFFILEIDLLLNRVVNIGKMVIKLIGKRKINILAKGVF